MNYDSEDESSKRRFRADVLRWQIMQQVSKMTFGFTSHSVSGQSANDINVLLED